MSQSWWDYEYPPGHAGTHAEGDDGEDIGTPDNTALSFPESGQVIDASYHVYGGQVVVHMPDGYDEYWIHLNKIFVSPGEEISPQEIIGTSGGGIGDLVLHNGKVQPAQSQSWYEGHSTGYHSELGFFQDTSRTGSMDEFNKGWGNRLRQLDPRPIIDQLRGKNPPESDPPGGQAGGTSQGKSSGGLINIDIGGGLADAGNRLVNALGFSDAKNMLLRVAVGGAGLVLMFYAVAIALQPATEAGVNAENNAFENVRDKAVAGAKEAFL